MLQRGLAILGALSLALLSACTTLQKAGPEQIVTVVKPVKSVPVTVSYQGGVFYHVQVNNNLPTAITLVWDESTYVTTSGESVRLLRVPDKTELPQHAPAQQAPSPISPHSQFQADFTGEEWLDCARRNCTPQRKDSLRNAKIYLAFNIKGKRVTWQGEVAFVAPRKP